MLTHLDALSVVTVVEAAPDAYRRRMGMCSCTAEYGKERMQQMTSRIRWAVAALAVVAGLGAARVEAQPAAVSGGGWEVSIAPLYLWASELDGAMTVGPRNVPIFMDFGTAVKNLSATFTFDAEVRKGRWGAFADLGFVRLGTDTEYDVIRPGRLTAKGRVELDNLIFETGGAAWLTRDFAVIGGVRTYTFSPNVTLGVADIDLREVEISKTNVDAIAGVTWRPKLSPRLTLLTRADMGAGQSDFTWSGLVAVEYHVKPAFGLLVGYKGLGIDTGDPRGLAAAGGLSVPTTYDVTHYGPVFAGTFHWGR